MKGHYTHITRSPVRGNWIWRLCCCTWRLWYCNWSWLLHCPKSPWMAWWAPYGCACRGCLNITHVGFPHCHPAALGHPWGVLPSLTGSISPDSSVFSKSFELNEEKRESVLLLLLLLLDVLSWVQLGRVHLGWTLRERNVGRLSLDHGRFNYSLFKLKPAQELFIECESLLAVLSGRLWHVHSQ